MTGSLARTTAEAYVDAVNAVDLDGLVALFAEGAVLDHTFGTFEGTEAIRTFCADNVLAFTPQVTAGDWLEQGRTVTFHLEVSVDGATSQAVDHLTVDGAGLISHLEVGLRRPRRPRAQTGSRRCGVKHTPITTPSCDCTRATTWPHGSVRGGWRSTWPPATNSRTAASTSSTSNSMLACGTGWLSGQADVPKQASAASSSGRTPKCLAPSSVSVNR